MADGTSTPLPVGVTVKTVSVSYGRKLNLGDYNSANIEVTIWAELDPDRPDRTDVTIQLAELFDQAKETVKAQAMPLLKSNPTALNIRETFLGAEIGKDKQQ